MRIGIQTWGSEGDIRPFAALGGALAAAGHEVTLVATDITGRTWDADAQRLGIRVRMVAEPDAARLAGAEALARTLVRKNAFSQGRIIAEQLFRPALPEMFEAAQELCAESDLIVGHFFHYPVRIAAELAGLPEVSLTFSGDIIPSSAYAPTGIPSLGTFWNRSWWKLATGMLDRAFLPAINELRRTVRLAPLSRLRDAWHSRLVDLIAVSPTLCPQKPDWDRRHRVTGFLSLPDSSSETLSAEVEAFFGRGTPPVFIGFGSLTPGSPEARAVLCAILEQTAERVGCRIIIQGLTADADHESSESILHVQRVPHVRLFPRCAAIVHHGGAGTTQTVLSAGVPSVVIPHVADQFGWGRLLQRHGVAPRPLPRRDLAVTPLAARVRAALDPAMKEAASRLGARIRREDGCREAVRLIEDAGAMEWQARR